MLDVPRSASNYATFPHASLVRSLACRVSRLSFVELIGCYDCVAIFLETKDHV
jgi:hypothetical protein